MPDTLVSNSDIAKGMAGRTQALLDACFSCNRLRYSNKTVKYFIKAAVTM